jgi:hypothetical protein
MGRLVVLLVVTAGLPGILLGAGMAFLAFGRLPILPDGASWLDGASWSVPGGSLLAMASIVLAAVALATGVAARARPTVGSQ